MGQHGGSSRVADIRREHLVERVGGNVAVEVPVADRVSVVDDLDLQDGREQLTARESDRIQSQLDGLALCRCEGGDINEGFHVRIVGGVLPSIWRSRAVGSRLVVHHVRCIAADP